MRIKEIGKEKAWQVRHIVMWPDRDIDYIKLKEDDKGSHFGLYKNETLISVISLFIHNNEAQFRKFATLQHEQGKGYGSMLLDYVIREAYKQGVKKIWCNAREEKAAFYHKFGLEVTNDKFERGGKSYVIMERIL
ncbi:GNAT family N-acetyltransferase [Bacillus shivajii]|uniref:GNAT family N-acetyltransferase n=1 Tax=Bacillus shivajii TaxID=1983719 RepID=UPI001CFAA474|nr:GNAT family N-acetyltransferase [Bacillus shivajii]UCZ55293.1 GNAT family N-acetyltransferase [Bacillus shivajii]